MELGENVNISLWNWGENVNNFYGIGGDALELGENVNNFYGIGEMRKFI